MLSKMNGQTVSFLEIKWIQVHSVLALFLRQLIISVIISETAHNFSYYFQFISWGFTKTLLKIMTWFIITSPSHIFFYLMAWSDKKLHENLDTILALDWITTSMLSKFKKNYKTDDANFEKKKWKQNDPTLSYNRLPVNLLSLKWTLSVQRHG
jgi:hypothetical protein